MSSEVALLVVDMQEYFCRRDSLFGKGWAAVLPEETEWYQEHVTTTVIPTIAGLIDRARGTDGVIAFTEFGSRTADGSDLPIWARRHNEMLRPIVGGPIYPPLTAPESRVIPELQPAERELVIEKNSSGPLAGSTLVDQFRDLGVTRVVTAGVATNVCVLGMVRELADSDFDVCVVRDACSTLGKDNHEATLASGFPPFGSVLGSDQLDDWLS